MCPAGIDKITETSQVSEDGTMVAVPHSDAAQVRTPAGGGSDTESNSERDQEVKVQTLDSSHSAVVSVIAAAVCPCVVRLDTPTQRQRRGVGCRARRPRQPGPPTQTGLVVFKSLSLMILYPSISSIMLLPVCPQVLSWKAKLPLQTIMRLLQVLVPQVEKICIDK